MVGSIQPAVTEAVLFSLKNIEAAPELIFDNTFIDFVDYLKHLGITFSSNGQWHLHIENIKSAPTKILGIMQKLKLLSVEIY